MRRNPEVAFRTPERVSKARAGISERDIRKWFADAKQNFEGIPGALEAISDPRRVFNTDETCIQLAPPTGKVISITGWKNVYEVAPGPVKSNLTFLGTYNANGETITPMILYPYVRLPAEIKANVPERFYQSLTESGWMTAKSFYEFIANPFKNWLNAHEIPRPVILFVDGHRTHITLQTSVECDNNGIILYLLPPNTTHMLQPADVGPFRPMKHYWREEVIDRQRKNPGVLIARKDVAPMLDNIIDKIASSCIINGFRKSGIFPFDADAVDYSKCLDIEVGEEDDNEDVADVVEPEVVENRDYKEAFKCVKEILGDNNLRKSFYNELGADELNLMIRTLAHRAEVEIPVQNVPEDLPLVPSAMVMDHVPNEAIEIVSEPNSVYETLVTYESDEVPSTIAQEVVAETLDE